MTFILSTGKEVDPMFPVSLIGLTKEEYAELIELCRKRNEEKAA